MASKFGSKVSVSVFGESHGPGIGVVVNGLPAGEEVDLPRLMAFMARRRGGGPLSTARAEADRPEFISGVLEGKTTGTPLCAIIKNQDARSADYAAFKDVPRPGHADYVAQLKWGGHADMRGGGHFSGRLTAPLCVAGGIALQLLERRGVYIGAHLFEVAGERDAAFGLLPGQELLKALGEKPFPVLDEGAGERMQAAIQAAAAEKDSVGGVVECCAVGVPAGLGGPMFGGVEGKLAQALFGIPAVKGVEFGAGFKAAASRGSLNNDQLCIGEDGSITHLSNNAGGLLGGITNGMPLLVRAAFKPTPSIAREQASVNLAEGKPAVIEANGRHDPCVAHRAVPVVEAVTALVVLDIILEGK